MRVKAPMNFPLKVVIAVIVSGLSVPAFARVKGGKDGGGSDRPLMDQGSAWFVGKTPVPYCIEIADGFFGPAIAREEAERRADAVVANVVRTWRNYLAEKEVSQGETQLVINTNFVKNCGAPAALRILLGGMTPAVEKARSRYTDPYAFAVRESSPYKSGMGSGFIWVRPTSVANAVDWNWPNTLNGVLLHEFGHVLGNEHVHGTIMADDMGWRITMASDRSPVLAARAAALLTQIDDTKELFKAREFTVVGQVGSHDFSATAPAVFQRFVGRPAKGTVTAKLATPAYGSDHSLDYILVDSTGEHRFPVSLQGEKADHGDDVPDGDVLTPMDAEDSSQTFRVAHSTPGDILVARSSNLTAVVKMGFVKTVTGETFPVVFARNMENGPFELRYFVDGKVRTLFVSPLKGIPQK